jgi:hypothetical protein
LTTFFYNIIDKFCPEKKRDRELCSYVKVNAKVLRDMLRCCPGMHSWSFSRGRYFSMHTDLAYLIQHVTEEGVYMDNDRAWVQDAKYRWGLYDLLSLPLEKLINFDFPLDNLLYRELACARLRGDLEGQLPAIPEKYRARSREGGPGGGVVDMRASTLLLELIELIRDADR